MKTLLPSSFAAALMLGLTATSLHANADNFADATDIPYSNWSSGPVSLLTMTSEAGEPTHRPTNDPGAGKTVWWKWTAPANGLCIVDTVQTYGGQVLRDPVLSVYTGVAVNALTRIIANDDQGAFSNGAHSEAAGASFRANQGTTYYIAVDSRLPSGVTMDSHKVTLRLRHLLDRAENRIAVFGGADPELISARFDLSKTISNTYTLKVFLNGKTYSFAGLFGLDGFAVHAIPRAVPKGAPPRAPITVFLDGCQNGDFAITTDEFGLYSTLGANVKKFTPAQPNGLKGLYSATYGGMGDGGGVISMNISATGLVTGALIQPDGTKGTFGTSLCDRDATSCAAPVHCSMYNHRGFFYAFMRVTEGGAVDVLSTNYDSGFYRPPTPGATFLPDGMERDGINLTGSTYTPPAVNTRALGFLNATTGAGKLSIPQFPGEVSPAITENLTFDLKSIFKFTTPAARKPVLTLNKANGMVTGSILDQAGKKRTLTGVLYRDGMTVRLSGQMSGTTRNVDFEVIP